MLDDREACSLDRIFGSSTALSVTAIARTAPEYTSTIVAKIGLRNMPSLVSVMMSSGVWSNSIGGDIVVSYGCLGKFACLIPKTHCGVSKPEAVHKMCLGPFPQL